MARPKRSRRRGRISRAKLAADAAATRAANEAEQNPDGSAAVVDVLASLSESTMAPSTESAGTLSPLPSEEEDWAKLLDSPQKMKPEVAPTVMHKKVLHQSNVECLGSQNLTKNAARIDDTSSTRNATFDISAVQRKIQTEESTTCLDTVDVDGERAFSCSSPQLAEDTLSMNVEAISNGKEQIQINNLEHDINDSTSEKDQELPSPVEDSVTDAVTDIPCQNDSNNAFIATEPVDKVSAEIKEEEIVTLEEALPEAICMPVPVLIAKRPNEEQISGEDELEIRKKQTESDQRLMVQDMLPYDLVKLAEAEKAYYEKLAKVGFFNFKFDIVCFQLLHDFCGKIRYFSPSFMFFECLTIIFEILSKFLTLII